MKKKELIYLISILLFSWLFYKQQVGINYFFFSVAITAGWGLINTELLRDKLWRFFAIASVAGGFAVWLYANTLGLWACILSLSLLSALSYSRGATPALGIIYSALSYVTSPVRMIIDTVNYRKKSDKEKGNTKLVAQIGTGIVILLVVFVFFVLYQQSNTLFRQFTEMIDLSWINFNWFMFTLLGAIILYGYYYPVHFSGWHYTDTGKPDSLPVPDESDDTYTFLKRPVNQKLEYSAGILLLVLLNLLLLMVNAVDIVYLYFREGIPQGMTYSEFVHQGTGNLILSIIIAILIIMYLFRGKQHFVKSHRLKQISGLWVLQNVILVSSAAYKNILYINEYALTYKRIGVFIYLLLAITGLAITILKIKNNKSNWYLVRRNSVAFMAVLVISSLINWDGIIVRSNLKHYDNPDYSYLLDLGYYPLPYLMQVEELKAGYNEVRYGSNDDSNYSQIRQMHLKLFDFLENEEELTWKSHCIMRELTRKKVLKLINEGNIPALLLSPHSYDDHYLKLFTNAEGFEIKGKQLRNDQYPPVFRNAKYLNLSENNFSDLSPFIHSSQLEYLGLSSNSLRTLKHLPLLVNLKTLDIGSNRAITYESLKADCNVEELIISGNVVKHPKFLSHFPKLRILIMNNMDDIDLKKLPEMPTLKILEVYGNSHYAMQMLSPEFRRSIQSIEQLNAGNCNISSLLFLTNYPDIVEKNGKYDSLKVVEAIPALKQVSLNSNRIKNIDALVYLKSIEEIDLSQNEIKIIPEGRHIPLITHLNLKSNNISDIKGIGRFTNLEWLDLSGNANVNTEPLAKLNKLKYLNLNGMDIKNFSSLINLKDLKKLEVLISSLEALKSLGNLNQVEELHLSLTENIDIKQFAGMNSLKTVYLNSYTELQHDELREVTGKRVNIIRTSDPREFETFFEELDYRY